MYQMYGHSYSSSVKNGYVQHIKCVPMIEKFQIISIYGKRHTKTLLVSTDICRLMVE